MAAWATINAAVLPGLHATHDNRPNSKSPQHDRRHGIDRREVARIITIWQLP